MKNNILFKEIYEEVKIARYILIIIPNNANCDIISSFLALSNCFFENKIKHKVYCNDKIPDKLNFLSKYDKVSNSLPKFYDLLIYLDDPENKKINFSFDNNIKSISFLSNNKVLKNSIASLVYDFINVNEFQISKNIAECLYVGIYDYSTGFTDNINADSFVILSKLLQCDIDVSLISNNLLQRNSLSKFKCTNQILNTLELFNEGKLASIYLDDKMIKETGIDINECDEVLNKVLSIGIVDIVVYFKINGDTIEVSLKSKNNIDISYLITKLMIKTKKTFTFNVDSNNIFETKKKTMNAILNYI